MDNHETTFRRWVTEYRGIVRKVTRVYGFTREDREDLAQEIFLQLWRSIPAFQGAARESTWVYRVSLNTAMTWRRKVRPDHTAEAPGSDTPCPSPPPDTTASSNEVVAWLYDEIALLPKVDRSLVLLHLDGENYRAIAEILGMSEGNVGVRLHRLRGRLAARMKGVSHDLW